MIAGRRALCAEPCNTGLLSFNGYSPALFTTNKSFDKPPARPSGQRQSWSEIRKSPEDRDKLAGQLRKACRVLGEKSGLQGWMGQTYIHQQACSFNDVHATSSFLLWHRAFLYFHERLLQKVDPTLWLPAWDWDINTDLPSIYDAWNPLPNETCALPRSPISVPIDPCMLQAWLLSNNFTDFAGLPMQPTIAQPNTAGQANGGPHTLVHAQVQGYMSNVPHSAFDPLFYAHHANVDRFWCAWLQHYAGKPGFTPEFSNETWYFFSASDECVVSVNPSAGSFSSILEISDMNTQPPPA
jgi:hypothetical protein